MSEKFAFITTLRHPENTRDMEVVVELLNNTIRSILNQSYKNIELLIVCNEIPNGVIDSEKISYFTVDLAPPGEGKTTALNREAGQRDKGIKLYLGLIELQRKKPEYVYIIDSDDWIDTRVSEYIVKQDSPDVWFVDKGYLVDYQNSLKVNKSGLCRYCGSTYVYRYDLLKKIASIQAEMLSQTQTSRLENIDEFVVSRFLGNHKYQFAYLQKLNIELRPIPFYSICWVVNTGENRSGTKVTKMGFPFSEGFSNRFGQQIGLHSRRINIVYAFKALAESIKSYFGWMFANKKAEKV